MINVERTMVGYHPQRKTQDAPKVELNIFDHSKTSCKATGLYHDFDVFPWHLNIELLLMAFEWLIIQQ